jgi:hypothetical protein
MRSMGGIDPLQTEGRLPGPHSSRRKSRFLSLFRVFLLRRWPRGGRYGHYPQPRNRAELCQYCGTGFVKPKCGSFAGPNPCS